MSDTPAHAERAILYIGGSFPQLPGINAAKEVGLYTCVADRSEAAPGREVADRFACISATDVAGQLALAEGLAEERDLVGAYGVADYAYAAIGALAERFGWPIGDRETFRRTTDKSLTRAIWETDGIPLARGICHRPGEEVSATIVKALKELRFPVVVKPTCEFNSLGVRTVEGPDRTALDAAIFAAQVPGEAVVIEEYAEGRHFNVDLLFVDGEAYHGGITERFFLDHVSHAALSGYQPAEVTRSEQDSLYRASRSAAASLGIRYGPVTVDAVLGGGRVVVLEVSPHVHAVKLNALRGGCALKAWFAYLAGRRDWKRYLSPSPEITAGYFNVTVFGSGAVTAIEGEAKARAEDGVVDVSLRKRVGTEVRSAGGLPDVCAIVWATARDRESCTEAMERGGRHIAFRLKPS